MSHNVNDKVPNIRNVRSINGEELDIKLDGLTVKELRTLIAGKKNVPTNKIVLMSTGKKLKDTDSMPSTFIVYVVSKKKEGKSKPITTELIKEEPKEEPKSDIIQQRLESAGIIESKTTNTDPDIEKKVLNANIHYLRLKSGEHKMTPYIIDELIKIDSSVALIMGTIYQMDEHKVTSIEVIYSAHYKNILKLFADKNIILNPINNDDYMKLKYGIEELQFDDGILIEIYNKHNRNADLAISEMFHIMESN